MSFLDDDYCSNAPWKETNEKQTFRVGITATAEITVDVPSESSEAIAKEIVLSEVTNSLKDWKILNIEIE